MSDPHFVTAEEAQAILDVCHAPVPTTRPVVVIDGAPPSLLDCVPDLAQTVIDLHGELTALRDQRDRLVAANAGLTLKITGALVERNDLRAIVDGRTEPPTIAEVRAHDGYWLVVVDDGQGETWPWTTVNPHWFAGGNTRYVRYTPLNREKRPCAWPTVEEVADAP